MRYRPSTLNSNKQKRIDNYFEQLQSRLLAHIDGLLDEVHPEVMRQPIYETAFKASETLDKRHRRPKTEVACLVEQIYTEYSQSNTPPDALLTISVIQPEYYDIFDDSIDGDVPSDKIEEVVLITQTLMPIMTQAVNELGDDSFSHWSSRISELTAAPYYEATLDSSFESYSIILNKQSKLFGSLTGISALAAGCSEQEVSDAEKIGELFYKFEQLVLDCEQYTPDTDERWNIRTYRSLDGVQPILTDWSEQLYDVTSSYSHTNKEIIRSLLALDFEKWSESVE